jgi:hypothetical protein
MRCAPQFAGFLAKRCSATLQSWVPRFTLRRTRNSSSITPANREPARVVATAPTYSGCASAGPHCQMRFIRGSRSRCRVYFGSFSAENPPLAKVLSALAAEVIQARVRVKYGVRVGVIAILHTFNGELKFKSHVHTMVTGGGLHESSDIWVSRVYYDCDLLMKSWRKTVIMLLRAALRAGQLRTELTADQMEDLLAHLEGCWWSIKIQSFSEEFGTSQWMIARLEPDPTGIQR